MAPHELSGTRVLFVLCGFELGGAERQALHLARHLKGLGCEVIVWGHHHETHGPERVIEQCERAGIPWAAFRFRWPSRKVHLVRDVWRFVWGLWRVRPDVILPYTPWPCIACGWLWRLSTAKVCIWGQRDSDDFRPDWVLRGAYRRCSAAICNAPHAADFLKRALGEVTAPVYVVPNGVARVEPRRTRASWRAELGIDDQAVVVTMLANFRPQKDHAVLLRAWRLLLQRTDPTRRPHLVLAGAPQESHATVSRAAQAAEFRGTVQLPGPVDDVAGLLGASDVGVLTSHHEGLPNAILEYMTWGLPVVATDLPGNREALGQNPQPALYRPGDEDQLAVSLQLLLDDPGLRQRAGARNRQRAIEAFALETMCATMTGIVGDLLASANSRARTSP